MCESGSEIIFLSSIGHGAIEWPWVEGGGMKTCDSVAWGFLHGCVSLMGDVCPLLMPFITPHLLRHERHKTTVQNQEFPAACLHIGCPRIRLVVLAQGKQEGKEIDKRVSRSNCWKIEWWFVYFLLLLCAFFLFLIYFHTDSCRHLFSYYSIVETNLLIILMIHLGST